jgi:hypothetical protein
MKTTNNQARKRTLTRCKTCGYVVSRTKHHPCGCEFCKLKFEAYSNLPPCPREMLYYSRKKACAKWLEALTGARRARAALDKLIYAYEHPEI